MPRYDFSEYAPDRADDGNPGTEALNAYFSGDHWIPVNQPASVSDALSGRVYAGIGGKSASGTSEFFAAVQKRLYRINGTAWTDVSRGGADYTVDATAPTWQMIRSGGYIVAANHADILQYTTLGAAAAFANIAGTDQPKARRIGQLPLHLVVGDTSDATDGDVRHRIWWPKLGDPLTWPTRGSSAAAAAQSSYKDLEQGDGPVTAIAASEFGIIFQERAVTRMSYIGAPIIYQFDRVDKNRGALAPNSVVQAGRRMFFLSHEGFFVTDGTSESRPIGEGRVDLYVLNRINMSALELMSAVVDEKNNSIIWAYPVGSSQQCDEAIIYNYQYDKWSHADFTCDLLLQSVTPGFTLEQMDTFGTVDAQTITWDSPIFQGGQRSVALFNTAHKLCTFSGTPGTAVLETGDICDEGGQAMLFDGVRPIVQGGSPVISIGYRNQMTDAVAYTTPAAANSGTGVCDIRVAAKFARVRAQLTGDFGKAKGAEAMFALDGVR